MQFLTFIFSFVLLWQTPRRDNDWKVGAFSAILVFVVALVTISLILVFAFFAYKRRQQRIKSFQAFAAQNGWQFVRHETIFYFQNSSRHRLFRYGDQAKIISPLIHKPFDGGQVFVFDYSFTVGYGKNSKVCKMTVIAFHSPRLQLPYFALYAESSWSFLGELIGWNDIDFVSHPNFSKRYKLSSKDGTQEVVRQIFHPQMLTSFENMPDVSFEGGENYIFIYTPKQTIAVEGLNTHLGNAKNIYELFRPCLGSFVTSKDFALLQSYYEDNVRGTTRFMPNARVKGIFQYWGSAPNSKNKETEIVLTSCEVLGTSRL